MPRGGPLQEVADLVASLRQVLTRLIVGEAFNARQNAGVATKGRWRVRIFGTEIRREAPKMVSRKSVGMQRGSEAACSMAVNSDGIREHRAWCQP
jgi:hypothetical protein